MRILIREDQFSRVILREQEEISINKKDFSDKSNIATQTLWDNIRKWEEFVPFTYDDAYYPPKPFTGDSKESSGVLTIGYGHTGIDVKPGNKITEKEATKLLIAVVVLEPEPTKNIGELFTGSAFGSAAINLYSVLPTVTCISSPDPLDAKKLADISNEPLAFIELSEPSVKIEADACE